MHTQEARICLKAMSAASAILEGPTNRALFLGFVLRSLFVTSCTLHSAQAFAFRRTDGTVMTWGHEALGGNSRRVKDQLVDVKQILGLRDALVFECTNLVVSLVSPSIYVYHPSIPCTSAYSHIIPNHIISSCLIISYHITSYHIISYHISISLPFFTYEYMYNICTPSLSIYLVKL